MIVDTERLRKLADRLHMIGDSSQVNKAADEIDDLRFRLKLERTETFSADQTIEILRAQVTEARWVAKTLIRRGDLTILGIGHSIELAKAVEILKSWPAPEEL